MVINIYWLQTTWMNTLFAETEVALEVPAKWINYLKLSRHSAPDKLFNSHPSAFTRMPFSCILQGFYSHTHPTSQSPSHGAVSHQGARCQQDANKMPTKSSVAKTITLLNPAVLIPSTQRHNSTLSLRGMARMTKLQSPQTALRVFRRKIIPHIECSQRDGRNIRWLPIKWERQTWNKMSRVVQSFLYTIEVWHLVSLSNAHQSKSEMSNSAPDYVHVCLHLKFFFSTYSCCFHCRDQNNIVAITLQL